MNPLQIPQKVHLIYKLFLLESARSSLEENLRGFINQAYKDVHGVLNSSLSGNMFSDLAKTLDARCQQILRLSASLKNICCKTQVDELSVVRNGVRPYLKEDVLTNVLKCGPMLQNSLMPKALGASQANQQLKVICPWLPAEQQDKVLSSISSSYKCTIPNITVFCHVEPDQSDDDEEVQPEDVHVSDVTTQSPEEDPLMLPSFIPAIFPHFSNGEPLKLWGCDSENQLNHQKQTSTQLLRLLKANTSSKFALKVTALEEAKCSGQAKKPNFPQQISSSKTKSRHSTDLVTNDVMDILHPKPSQTHVANKVPVFSVKKESNGRLIYRCLVASETELWDMGDVATETTEEFPHKVLEGEDGRYKLSQEDKFVMDEKTQMLEITESEPVKSKPTPDSVSVAEFQYQKFQETEIVVSHIISPGNFYIQHTDCMEKLQMIESHCKPNQSYAEQNYIPDIGTQVVGWFPQKNQWCRAQVVSICGVSKDDNARNPGRGETSIKVEVKRLDVGDTARLSLFDVKKLPAEITAVPLQALQVSMANVTPINGRDWSEQSIGWFKETVHNRTLYARLYPEGPGFSVELFLERGKLGSMRRGASLSVRLAQNGHAKHRKLNKTPFSKRTAVKPLAF